MPSRRVANKFYRKEGNLIFDDEAAGAGSGAPLIGSAMATWTMMVDLDLIVNNVNDPVFVYRNNSR